MSENNQNSNKRSTPVLDQRKGLPSTSSGAKMPKVKPPKEEKKCNKIHKSD